MPLPFEAVLALWVVIASCLSFLQFGWDKLCAKNGWHRISEAKLLATALLGGAAGAKLGQHVFRHKIRKEPFRTRLNRLTIASWLVIPALAFPPLRTWLALHIL